jgi:hypothetical protein
MRERKHPMGKIAKPSTPASSKRDRKSDRIEAKIAEV